MVHVKKCPLGKRGRPSTEFWKDGKPQIYCRGWIDKMTKVFLSREEAERALEGK